MSSNNKKIASFMLFAIIFLAFLVSCGEGGNENDNLNDLDSSNNTREEIKESEEAAAEKLYPELEAVDFGGYEFTFLSRTIDSADWAEWNHRDISAEKENGDVINDAVFARNRKIEEKYNIKIKEIVLEASNFTAKIQQSVKAGDHMFDVIALHFNAFAPFAQGGDLINLFDVHNLDFAKPWWSQACVRDLSIINKLFIIRGDLTIMDNDAMEAMIFNKSVLQDYSLENPYDIVKKGEWTFEKLMQMSKDISKDLNGDGKMYIKDDMFGYILQGDTAASFIVSGGERICAKDENDRPIITFGSERSYKITDFLSEMFSDTANSVNLHNYENQFPIYDEQVKMFSENRALFSWIRMRIVERLRAMEMDFGILPLPKLDKNQEKYMTHINAPTGTGLSIPVTADNLERIGMILEDLCAESKYTLQPAYYDINLRGKYARDDESQEMLDIILSDNAVQDIGRIFNFGNFYMLTCGRYGRDTTIEWASTFEKVRGVMETDIEKMIAAYEN